MNQALFEYELAAFALPGSLDRPPPPRIGFAALESHRLDDSLDALDVVGLNAPVLALDAPDAVQLTEPAGCTTPKRCKRSSNSSSNGKTTPRGKAKRIGGTSPSASPPAHRHHPKKASRKQVHELQAMVNAMQVQVNEAAAEIQQLARLVGEFALHRQQEHERFRRHEQQQQQQQEELSAEHEMDMDLDAQQRHLCAQVELEREKFVREQQLRQEEKCYQDRPPPLQLIRL